MLKVTIPAFALLLTLLGAGVQNEASASDLLPEDPVSGVSGISQKSGSVYRRLGRRAQRALQENRDPFLVLGAGSVSAGQIRSEFETFCLDGDYADLVSWTRTPGLITTVSFSCILDGEFPKVGERIFVFSYENEESPERRLVDIAMASADLVAGSVTGSVAGPAAGRRQNLVSSVFSKSILAPRDSAEEKVAVAMSGAVLSSGATAFSDKFRESQAKPSKADLLSSLPSVSDVGRGALLAGLGAAISHFVFEPSTPGLAGGALSIVVEDLQEKVRRNQPGVPIQPQSIVRSTREGRGPITVYLSFKF